MKFKKTNNNPQRLAEAFRVISGKDAEKAADIIDSIIEYRDRFDLSDEEISSLEIAYEILFNCAPHVRESIKQKSLKENYNRGDILNIISTLEDIAYWDTKNRCELSKEDLQKIFDVVKILKGIPSYLPFEESLKEDANQRVRLHVEYYPYERYGSSGLKRANVSGVDKLDALKKMTDHMGLYIDSEIIEEEGYSFEDAINGIAMSNGDGCDFIVVIQDRDTGEVYFSENYEEEEDFDESLDEAKDVNLSDKSNSISGLLLDNKDKIDAAASQQELVKVCKDALAEKGGAKAQQFLAVLASKKGHYAALKYVYDFILAGEGMRSADSKRKTKPAHMKEALEEDFSTEQDLIDAGFEQAGYRKQYDFYRKKIDGKGTWYAVDTKSGNVFPITYEQARGYEPIDSEEGMSMKLGSMLLPH